MVALRTTTHQPIAHFDSSLTDVGVPIRTSEVISALSFALDLTEGQPMGHSVRSCVLGMHIGRQIGLSGELLGQLYYALLMKDAGCSTNASKMTLLLGSDDIQAKADGKTIDWTRLGWESLEFALSHIRPGAPFLERVRAAFGVALNQKRNAQEFVRIRCERGAAIARRIGLAEDSATAIHHLDELWNGTGYPQGLQGNAIPLFSRIMNLAQTIDVFYTKFGATAAIDVIRKRSGRWFDPNLVRAFRSLAKGPSLWEDVENARSRVLDFAPADDAVPGTAGATDAELDNICLAFADVIDAKSPFTYRHSLGVAGAAVSIAETLGMSRSQVNSIRRAALLHDIGKLGVSNTILDKPGKLTDMEWEAVRKHPRYSLEILKRVPGFADIAEIAASHHEKLDGSGYFRNMKARDLSLPARILVVSDIYDALSAKRPYRDALPLETVFQIMEKDAPHALDADCFEAMRYSSSAAAQATQDLAQLSLNLT